MFIETVEQSEVYATANKWKSKLSHGHDDISTKLLKNRITNINTGIVPQEMNIARVFPIYKSADQNLIKNYRPVSLLPAFSKLFGKITYKMDLEQNTQLYTP